jgi:DNA polymerase I
MELKFDPDNPKYEYITTMKHAMEAIGKLLPERVIGVDIEGTSLDPLTIDLFTVQVGTADISYVFDARALDLKNFPEFKELLENPTSTKLLQNAKFDYKCIKAQLGIEMTNLYDTMLAELVLNSGIGRRFYGLKHLAESYLEIKLDKEVRDSFAKMGKNSRLSEALLKYGAMDTLVLFPIFEAQIIRLRKEKLIKIAKLEFASVRVVGDMELRGIYIDRPRWEKIIKNLKKKRDEYRIAFQDIARPYYKVKKVDLFGNLGDAINTNSQVQLMNLFNNKLGIDIPSTGDAILSTVDHPVARALRNYRKYEKLISAFGDSLLEKLHPITKRFHPQFNQMGTATGRFSCNKPNLQQIPRNSEEAPFRECFNPQPGYKLVTADYSSFEMRILAELSGDEKMKKALNEGLDIHSYTASLMFNVPYTEDFKKKHPDLRQIAKPIGFGLMYGMGPVGLVSTLEMQTGEVVSKEVAQDYMEKYFSSYPSVRDFLDKTANAAARRGWSVTPAGRKRWYNVPEKSDPEYRRKISKIKREAKNHPIQGTNADAIKFALVYISERMKKDGIEGGITHTVHDEIVCEIRNDQAEDWALVQSAEMVRAAELFIKTVSVRSDPFVGDVWEH